MWKVRMVSWVPGSGLAGQHGADLHLLDARALNGDGELFGDLLVAGLFCSIPRSALAEPRESARID